MTKHTAERRWKHHIVDARTGKWKFPLYAAILKYGPDSFTIETLEHHDTREELCEAEKRLIAVMGTKFPNGYNLTDGGEGAPNLPPEVEAIRAANISIGLTGKKLSDEHRRSLSLSHMGKPSGRKGQTATPETRLKQSEAAKARYARMSPEERSLRSKHMRSFQK